MSDTKQANELNERYEHPDGSIIELIVDVAEAKKYNPLAIKMGNFDYCEELNGEIIKIERLNK